MIPVRVGLNLLAHYIITFCFLGKVTHRARGGYYKVGGGGGGGGGGQISVLIYVSN